MGFKVLVFVPNLIGYFRLLLIFVSWSIFHIDPPWALTCYAISVALDGLDGYTARTLNQCSSFGAFFDVFIDLVGRGMVWSLLYQFGYLMIAVEWLCFVCTHAQHGKNWKTTEDEQPVIVKAVMANGFKSPAGALAIAGVHGLPIWLYCYEKSVLPISSAVEFAGIGLLSAGRAVAMTAEVWYIWIHLKYLLMKDDQPD